MRLGPQSVFSRLTIDIPNSALIPSGSAAYCIHRAFHQNDLQTVLIDLAYRGPYNRYSLLYTAYRTAGSRREGKGNPISPLIATS